VGASPWAPAWALPLPKSRARPPLALQFGKELLVCLVGGIACRPSPALAHQLGIDKRPILQVHIAQQPSIRGGNGQNVSRETVGTRPAQRFGGQSAERSIFRVATVAAEPIGWLLSACFLGNKKTPTFVGVLDRAW
jgi:hypothetical protein